jgi:magnesium-transporting ATPase (P-type)
VDCVIFDKTGTLTEGRPQVTEALLLDERFTLAQVRHEANTVSARFSSLNTRSMLWPTLDAAGCAKHLEPLQPQAMICCHK